MRVFRRGWFLRGAALTLTMAFAVSSVAAQEDEAAQPAEEAPAITPDAPPAVEQDSIDAYQVRVAETDYLAGRLQVVDPITGEIRGVRKSGLLIIQNGKVVGRAETGVSGVAQIKNLPIGPYSVVAIGPDGMGAFGFEVLPMAAGVAVPSYRFDTLIVPGTDMVVAQREFCSAGAVPAGIPAPALEAGPPAPLPPVPVAFQEQPEADPGYELDPGVSEGAVSAPLKGQPILVRNGESGVGQILVFSSGHSEPIGMANTRVSFIRGGQLLGSVETDSEGYCGVVGLEDGYYSMVGVGDSGFVAMGVRVETFAAASAGAADSQVSLLQAHVPVDWRVAGAGPDAIGFAPGFACGHCGGPSPKCCGGCGAAPFGAPCGPFGGGCGGFGGGGGGFGAGGGGGLFGGGLLGTLVGAGIGAAIGAAIADDDDDDDEGGGGGVPVSPAGP